MTTHNKRVANYRKGNARTFLTPKQARRVKHKTPAMRGLLWSKPKGKR